jgi:ribonuclease HI
LGHRTNNEAEYLAAALGLRAARDLGVTRVILRADSELLIRQVLGIYRVKNEKLIPLFAQLMAQLKKFTHWQAEHVPRARNALADRMANRAIDTRPGRLGA